MAPAPTATPSVQPGFGEEGEKEVQGLRGPVLPVPAWSLTEPVRAAV